MEKNFFDIVSYMQKDADNITKNYNKALAYDIYLEAHNQARNWYSENKPQTKLYERTRQLSKNATLYKQYSDFEYKVSFEADFIIRQSRDRSKLASYEDSRGEDVATSVLEWEENEIGPFAKYNRNIWEETLKEVLNHFDYIYVKMPKLYYITDNIGKDLLEALKKKSKKQLEKIYKEYKKNKIDKYM
jgi:hypothetical protein